MLGGQRLQVAVRTVLPRAVLAAQDVAIHEHAAVHFPQELQRVVDVMGYCLAGLETMTLEDAITPSVGSARVTLTRRGYIKLDREVILRETVNINIRSHPPA